MLVWFRVARGIDMKWRVGECKPVDRAHDGIAPPMDILNLFQPCKSKLLATLFAQAPEEVLHELAMSDGGWGEEETVSFLQHLRDQDEFDGPIEWQVKENLELASCVGRLDAPGVDAARPRDELVERLLASAVLVRASGEEINQRYDFFGIENRVAQLLASALALGVPMPHQACSLLAWRLEQRSMPLDMAEPFLWLGLLVASVLGAVPGIGTRKVLLVAESTLDAHRRSISSGEEGLRLKDQILGDRWGHWLRALVTNPVVVTDAALGGLVSEIRSAALDPD